MLSDTGNALGKALGLVYSFTDDLHGIYNFFKLDIPAINEAGGWELPMPARIIAGTDGIIRDIKADPDYRSRPEPSEAIEIVKSLARPAAA